MGEAQQNCRGKKLYICQTSEDEFLDVSKSFCETDTAKSPVEKDNNVKTDESLKPSTTNKRRVSENTLGLERFGKDFSLKITRSLSPTPFRKKTQQITSTRSSHSSSCSSPCSSSTPQQARRPSFLKSLDILFGPETRLSCEQSSLSSPGNMMFLGQIYRENFD